MFERTVDSRVESTHITNTEWVRTTCPYHETWRRHNKNNIEQDMQLSYL